MTLTKVDIIKQINKIGFTKKKSTEMLQTLFETIKLCLENGEDVLISGFGKFCVKDKRERRGRNPQTGDNLLLGERRVVTFRCSPVLKYNINGKRKTKNV